jgi:carbonic anhydrase
LLGGLPIAQVVIRSSVNITAGAKTNVATIINGALLLGSVLLIPAYLNMIPLASLAAVLLFMGYRLCRFQTFSDIYRFGISQFGPFIATIVGIIFTDIITGLIIGLAVSVFYIFKGNYHRPFSFRKEAYHEGERIKIELAEELTFINKASIMIMLEEIPQNTVVIIDGSRSKYIDFDVIEIIESFIAHAPLRNIEVQVLNVPGINQSHAERRVRVSTGFSDAT